MRINLRTTGMEFASEMVVKATIYKFRIAEVPTTLSPDGRSRPPHMRSWRDGWRNLRFFLLYSPRWLFLYPGLLLMLVGLALGLWLLPGPRRMSGGVALDVHTMLYAAAAVFIGFQAVAFSAFTKVFAITAGLRPTDPSINRLFRLATLERGLAIGAVLSLMGILGSVYAVSDWGAKSFGDLDPQKELRDRHPVRALPRAGLPNDTLQLLSQRPGTYAAISDLDHFIRHREWCAVITRQHRDGVGTIRDRFLRRVDVELATETVLQPFERDRVRLGQVLFHPAQRLVGFALSPKALVCGTNGSFFAQAIRHVRQVAQGARIMPFQNVGIQVGLLAGCARRR